MTRDQEIETVRKLGAEIGYGNVMSLASKMWREKLQREYGEGTGDGAFIPVLKIDIIPDRKNEYQEYWQNYPIK